jgi:Thermolysin metallopeptidase, alpha-helical domain
MAHGVTRYSSALEYQYQAGGMNEAFSDIVAAAVECLANDSKDIPDFDIGEMLGANKLRNMEHPMDSSSISSVCDYQSHYDVHHTSGPLNKAFVSSVRYCEQSECGAKAGCGCTILIGSIFMYANIQSLTAYSGYLDGATATCSIIDEYYAAKAPETSCNESSIETFIRQGWSTVNVSLNDSCEAVTCCTEACPDVQSAPLVSTPGPTAAAQSTSQPTGSPIAVITAPPSSHTVEPVESPNVQAAPLVSTPGPTAAAHPTSQPTGSPISVTAAPTSSHTVEPVESGEKTMLLKVLEFLESALTLFNSYNNQNEDLP